MLNGQDVQDVEDEVKRLIETLVATRNESSRNRQDGVARSRSSEFRRRFGPPTDSPVDLKRKHLKTKSKLNTINQTFINMFI